MAVLKPTTLVTFDENNPEHVKAIVEILEGNQDPSKPFSRNVKINFDYPHPFNSAVAYATYRMAMAWGQRFGFPAAVPPSVNGDHKVLMIGSRSLPLQDTPSRELGRKVVHH